MEPLLAAHRKVEAQGGLSKAIDDVQKTIDLLKRAREQVAADGHASLHLAQLKQPLKQNFDSLNQDVKEIHSSLNNYTKALDKKFKNMALPAAANDPFSSHPSLVNRALAMHLLREGQFRVASTFIAEANAKPPITDRSLRTEGDTDTVMEDSSWASDFAMMTDKSDASGDLQSKFGEMYHILHSLRNERNVEPAIRWAQKHSEALELRGSNLEFELCRLRFVELYNLQADPDAMAGDGVPGPLRALEYARNTFPYFSSRYLRETSSLLGSLAFAPSIKSSPYQHVFFDVDAWDNAAASFTREFCGMLGLSEKSPLYSAVTAGGIALPILEKLERVMGEVGGQWTSANELPVEIPLPPSYLFHSIFVCPVSKEQSTDANPPMMMPCGHVIAKESLEKISKASKFKCPYCPGESHPSEAKKVFL